MLLNRALCVPTRCTRQRNLSVQLSLLTPHGGEALRAEASSVLLAGRGRDGERRGLCPVVTVYTRGGVRRACGRGGVGRVGALGFTCMELLHQGGHGVGDGVSSHQQVIAEVSPRT